MVINDMGNKQTAVDWLFEKITQNQEIRWRGTRYLELFEQAKQIEKEQIKDAYDKGVYNVHPFHNSEEFYNAIYGK